MNWFSIISAILGVAVVITTIKWNRAKNVLKETSELLVDISSALEDDKVTVEEIKKIVSSCQEVIVAARNLTRT